MRHLGSLKASKRVVNKLRKRKQALFQHVTKIIKWKKKSDQPKGHPYNSTLKQMAFSYAVGIMRI